MKNQYSKYENKDKRCTYPFEASPLGYCWGYATYVDENKNPDNFKIGFCLGCEFWKESRRKAAVKTVRPKAARTTAPMQAKAQTLRSCRNCGRFEQQQFEQAQYEAEQREAEESAPEDIGQFSVQQPPSVNADPYNNFKKVGTSCVLEGPTK